MINTKHEDAIMKMGFGYFRESILKRLGINYEFVAEESPELIELQIHSMYMDFTFLTSRRIFMCILNFRQRRLIGKICYDLRHMKQ